MLDITKWNIIGSRFIVGGTDLGVVKDVSPTENVNEYPFTGSYDGGIFEYDSAVVGGDLSFTLVSSMVLDDSVMALWAGSDGGIISRGFSEMVQTQIQGVSGIAGREGRTFTLPRTKIRRNGWPAFNGESEAQLPFLIKVFWDSASGRYGTWSPNTISGAV